MIKKYIKTQISSIPNNKQSLDDNYGPTRAAGRVNTIGILLYYSILRLLHRAFLHHSFERFRFCVFAGDEILCVNDESVGGMTHAQAINCFKKVRQGPLGMKICRRKIISDSAAK